MNPSPDAVNSQRTEDATTAFDTLDIPLNEVALASQLLSTRTLNINGQLKVDRSLILTPSTQPTSGIAGQMYYDSSTNQLNYYNGTGYVALGTNPQTVTSIGGTSGTLTLGGGLSLAGSVLSNTGIVSITSASTNLTVTNDGGNVTIANTPGAPQGVQSVGGTNGRIALFNGAQTIGDSLLSQSGNLLTAEANVQVNGAIELQAAGTVTLRLTDTVSGVIGQIYNDGNLHVNGGQNNLWLDAGGSGTIFMNAANGNRVAINQATEPDYPLEVNGDINISDTGGSLRIGGTAICTITGCVTSGGGGSGVTSLNGIDGALTLANATGVGTTITINDATTAAKGIASFNSTNFTTTSGAVNTIQNINTTAAPTFGQLTLLSSQATAAMLTVNNTNASGTGNLLDLQLNGTSEFAVSPLGNLTLNGTVNGQTISSAANFTGTLGVTGNISTSATLFANAIGVTTNINASGTTSTGALSVTNNAGVGGNLTVTGATNTNTITPTAALTVGSTTQAFTLQGSATSTITATGGGFTTTVGFTGTPSAAVAYNFDRAAAAGTYLICTTAGNCAGVGGGVTTAGGSTNQLAKFTGSQAIGNSIISDNGSTVTIAGTLTVNAILPSAALTIGATSQDLTLQGANTTLSATNSGVTNSLVFATPASGNKSITIPNASGTICLTSGNCAGVGGTGDVLQGGNTFGTTMTLGSNDAFDFNLETSGVTRLSIAANGSSITLSNNTDLFLQGSSAFISNSQGSSGEAFGFDAAVGGNAVAVGRQAIAGTGGAFGSPVAVGYQASAASWGTAIGGQSSTTGDESVAIGNSATAASQGIAIGVSASTAGDTGSIAIGFNASTTASNQLVVGSNNFGITQAFFGSGVTDATPSNFTLQATGGSGTNIAGASLTISGGAGTGNASGGNVNLQVATPGASGSSANVPVTVMSLSGTTGAALFQNAANSAVAFQVQNAGGTSVLTIDTTNILTRISGAGSDASLVSGTGAIQIGSDAGANLAFDDNEIIARNNGAASTLFVQNGGGGLNVGANSSVFQVAADGDSLTVLNAAGNRVVNVDTAEGELELGTASTLNGALVFRNSTNNFTALLRAPTLSAHRSITLPDADGTICLQNNTSCGFALSTGGNGYIRNDTAQQTANFNILSAAAGSIGARIEGAANMSAQALLVRSGSNPTANALEVQDSAGVAILGVSGTGGVTIRTMTDSATALRVRNNADGNVFNVDTASGDIDLGFMRVGVNGLGGSFDTILFGAPISIGGTNANGVTIGHSGINTNVTGNLVQSTGTFSLTGNNSSSISTTTNALTLTSASTATWSTTSGSLTLQSTNASNNIVINGGSNTMTLNTGSSGTITLGSANTATTNVGALTNNARTVNVGVGTGGSQTQTVNVGSLGGASATTINAGTGNLALNSNGSITTKSVTNSANALRVLNASDAELLGMDSTDSILRVLANNTGHIPSFTSDPDTISAREGLGMVTVNGYAYILGGCNSAGTSTATAQYARLNADGSVGTWNTTTSFPTANCNGAATSYNGYIYVNGGTSSAGTSDDIYYAKPNADGTITAWTTASTPLTTDLRHHQAVARGGYIYFIGGERVDGTDNQNVYYAKLNADGSVGAFSTVTTWLPAVKLNNVSVTANGYLYVMGGATSAGGTGTTTVYYGKFRSDGSVGTGAGAAGAASTTSTLPLGRTAGAGGIMNGYVYYLGGASANVEADTVFYAPINNDGTVGTWVTDTTVLPQVLSSPGAGVLNGYIYAIGGWNNVDEQATVYYSGGTRLKVGASLDLVGFNGENMNEGGSSSGLTAGNSNIVGTLNVSGNANFGESLSVSNNLSVVGEINTGTFSGAGLADCDSSNSKLLWDSTSKQFSCGTDRASFTARKAADQTVTNSIVLQDDDTFQFSVGANETWAFQIYADVNSSSTADWRFRMDAPAGSTCDVAYNNVYNVTNYYADTCNEEGTIDQGDTFDNEYIIYGSMVSGGTPGTVKLRWAQSTASGSTIVRRGSYMVAYKLSGADLAEAYYTKDNSIAPGDVVSLDPNSAAGVIKSTKGYDTTALGVISTQPGHVLSDPNAGNATGRPALVALSGRIPVKVTNDNGAIRAGDFLTTSSTPGVAMKATRPGQVIGRALADYDGPGQGVVLMFASQQWADPRDPDGQQLQSDLLQSANITNLTAETATFDTLTVKNNANFLGDVVVRGNVSVATLTVNGHIVTGGDTPAVSADACNGATAEVNGNDTAGMISVTTSGTCSGELAKISFAKAFGAAPRVSLTPANAATAVTQAYVDSDKTSATSFTIATPTTINRSTTYRWYYQILQ